MPRKKFGRNRKNRCRFCTPEGCPRPAYVDYKDVGLLKKLCTNQNKIFSRKRSGSCAAFQRASSAAVSAPASCRCCRTWASDLRGSDGLRSSGWARSGSSLLAAVG